MMRFQEHARPSFLKKRYRLSRLRNLSSSALLKDFLLHQLHMPAAIKRERRPHPAANFVKVSLNHPPGVFKVAQRKANGGPQRPIVLKRRWKDLPGWIALYAERGAAKKCWENCPLLPATHDGRRYGGCQIRGCSTTPKPGDRIEACVKCKWSVCDKCADRTRMPTLAQDPLFHGPDDPCLLTYPQFDGMVGRGTVIVCPGGNYEFLSPLEGLPVVEWLAQHGIGAVVLRYRLLPDYCLDDALDDLEAAANRLRGMRSGPVAALGFSAGGHLIASLGLRSAQRKQAQPLDAQVLVYPGIDGRDWHSPEYNGFFTKGKWQIPRRAATLHQFQVSRLLLSPLPARSSQHACAMSYASTASIVARSRRFFSRPLFALSPLLSAPL